MTLKTTLLEVPFSGGMLRGTITERTPPTPSFAKEGVEYKCKTLLCIHGFEWPASLDQKFRFLAEQLPQHDYRVIRFDHRGIGLSDGDFRDTRLATFAEDIELVMNHITPTGIVDIASYSIGTCNATLYQQKHPERVNKIIYFGAAFDHAGISRFITFKRILRTLPLALLGTSLLRERTVWKFRGYAPVKKIFAKSFHKTKFSHEISSDFYRDLLETDVNDLVARIPQEKRLWIHGEQDKAAPVQNVSVHFEHKLMIPKGDHHLERQVFIDQWWPTVKEFLFKR